MGRMIRLIMFMGGVVGVGFLVLGGIRWLVNTDYATEVLLGMMSCFTLGAVAGLAVGTMWTAWGVRFGASTVGEAVKAASGSNRALNSLLGQVAVAAGRPQPPITVSPSAGALPGQYPRLRRFALASGDMDQEDADDI